jgi:hypothetical protein
MIAIFSNRKHNVGDIIKVNEYDDSEGNVIQAMVIKEITEQEYIDFHKEHCSEEVSKCPECYELTGDYPYHYMVSED